MRDVNLNIHVYVEDEEVKREREDTTAHKSGHFSFFFAFNSAEIFELFSFVTRFLRLVLSF